MKFWMSDFRQSAYYVQYTSSSSTVLSTFTLLTYKYLFFVLCTLSLSLRSYTIYVLSVLVQYRSSVYQTIYTGHTGPCTVVQVLVVLQVLATRTVASFTVAYMKQVIFAALHGTCTGNIIQYSRAT
jgi:hypothetical protein